MADFQIVESGMHFGPFPEASVFHIEASSTYTDSLRVNGVKVCEFLLKRGNKLYFIEAKSSIPQYDTALSSEEKRQKYLAFIHDIGQKMRDSLSLYTSILLKCNNGELHDLAISDFSSLQLRFVLIVKGAQPEWLIHYPDVLRKELNSEMNIWKIPAFSVITEEKARSLHFLE